jgi:hypothetical protein
MPRGTSGTIVPNGGMGPSVVNHYYIDSRTDRASIAAILSANERRIYDNMARVR